MIGAQATTWSHGLSESILAGWAEHSPDCKRWPTNWMVWEATASNVRA
jgi:hypothetical protein